LVAFDDLGLLHFPRALGTPALLLDARPALAVQLIERERGSRLSRGEHLDRDIDETDLEKAAPGCSCRHSFAPLMYRTRGRSRLGAPLRAVTLVPGTQIKPCPGKVDFVLTNLVAKQPSRGTVMFEGHGQAARQHPQPGDHHQ